MIACAVLAHHPSSEIHEHGAVSFGNVVAENLNKGGWSLGWVAAVDAQGRTIWIVDAHRDDGKSSLWRESIAFGNRAEFGRDIS